MSFPATEGFEYAGLLLTEDIALASDCDWTGLGTIAFRDGAYIDLLGHKLDVSGFSGVTAGKSGFTDSTTDAEHLGELHIHVAEGETLSNDKVVLAGNMKVVKEGKGKYVSARSQTYSGGTLIAEGTAQPHDTAGSNNTTYSGDNVKAFGTNVLAVASGAVFDVRSNYAYYGRHRDGRLIRLEGGTFSATGPSDMTKSTWGGSGIGAMTADSTLAITNSLVFQSLVCDLGGHTLTVPLNVGKYWYVHGTSFTNGVIDITSGGWLTIVDATDARTVDFKVSCAVDIAAQLDVRGYEPRYSGAAYHKGSAPLNVHGTFKPAEHDYFYGCTLMNGAEIDLSNRTNALPMTAAFTTDGLKTISFASGATVNVMARARNATKTANGKQLISWSAIPEGVTFVPVNNGQRLVPKVDGLYLENSGVTIIVR